MKTLIAIACLLFTACSAFARTWTATDGRTLEAELVAKTATAAIVTRDGDGVKLTLPLAMLSAVDRSYVERANVPTLRPMKEAVGEWFSRKRPLTTFKVSIDDIIRGGDDEQFKKFVHFAKAWVAELKAMEQAATDTVDDRRIIITSRRTRDQLEKAISDSSQAAEAVRSLAALRADTLR